MRVGRDWFDAWDEEIQIERGDHVYTVVVAPTFWPLVSPDPIDLVGFVVLVVFVALFLPFRRLLRPKVGVVRRRVFRDSFGVSVPRVVYKEKLALGADPRPRMLEVAQLVRDGIYD